MALSNTSWRRIVCWASVTDTVARAFDRLWIAKEKVSVGPTSSLLDELCALSMLEGNELPLVVVRGSAAHLTAVAALQNEETLLALKAANRASESWEGAARLVRASMSAVDTLYASPWRRLTRASTGPEQTDAVQLASISLQKTRMLVAVAFAQQRRFDDAIAIASKVVEQWRKTPLRGAPSLLCVERALQNWLSRKGQNSDASYLEGQSAALYAVPQHVLSNQPIEPGRNDNRLLLAFAEAVSILPRDLELSHTVIRQVNSTQPFTARCGAVSSNADLLGTYTPARGLFAGHLALQTIGN
ncbi:hypothetical protein Bphy_4844 [Paraburkholderia phymatum STM815]|uniref:Uncharacterized protein n=2 Tax=Paraburkholderia phymatum TaxID=148447 RepID=B2JSD0_PARP8|nr:hypothetical protein Bphy_4844 [Paraburkholderia phymatum STM815]